MSALSTRGRVLVAGASALVLLAVAVLWALTRSAPEVAVDPAVTLTTPGVVVTPHVAGGTTAMRQRLFAIIKEQLERYVAGDEPVHQVPR